MDYAFEGEGGCGLSVRRASTESTAYHDSAGFRRALVIDPPRAAVNIVLGSLTLRPALGCRWYGGNLGGGMHVTVPALLERRWDPELVKHAADDVVDQIVDRLRMIVERRHRRQHGHAHARELEHILEMHFRERRLAHHQHELAALFEHHVSGAMHEVVADPLCDAAKRTHRAWDHHHAFGQERPG